MVHQEIMYSKMLIGNHFVDAKLSKHYSVMDPASGKSLVNIPEASKEDVDLAVEAARLAFRMDAPWRMMDASARGRLLLHLVDLLKRDMDILSKLEAMDTGKPLGDAILDVKHAIDVFQYFAGYSDKIHGKVIPVDGLDVMSHVRRMPIGVVAQILSYDYPIDMLAWKAAPALAAGNVLIIKPSYKNPLTALHIAGLVVEAGFPDGVVNVLSGHGDVVGQALALHDHIDHVVFVGKSEIGKLVMESAARSNLKKVSLQLSGKSPLIVLKDFDVKLAVRIAHRAVFDNLGQNPSAAGRIYVHEDIHDEFVRLSVELARKSKIGNPFETNVHHGPLVDEKALRRVLNYIEMGKKEGAKLEYGGNRIGSIGYFIEPAIFTNVLDNMLIAKEDLSGPVQVILKFKNFDEVIERANASKYGLAAGILSYNIDHALVFAKRMRHGSIWINSWGLFAPQLPYGGLKMSGLSRDLGYDSLNEYLVNKSISLRLIQPQLEKM